MHQKKRLSVIAVSFFQVYLLISLTIVSSALVSGTPPVTNIPAGGYSELLSRTAGGQTFANTVPATTFGPGATIPAGTTLGEGSIISKGALTGNGKPYLLDGSSTVTVKAGDTAVTTSESFAQEGANGVASTTVSATGALIQGLFWGVALYAGIKMLGGLFGAGEKTTNALANPIPSSRPS